MGGFVQVTGQKADMACLQAGFQLAQQLLVEIQDGRDFAEVAKEHSNGPSAPQGGMLGEFPRGMMVPEFDQAAFALEPNTVSEVVETAFGFHIIKRIQ